jgi:hypothetical protein
VTGRLLCGVVRRHGGQPRTEAKGRRVVGALAAAAVLGACAPHAKLAIDMRTVSITAPRLLTPAVELVPAEAAPVSLPPVPPVVSLLPAPAPVAVRAPACPIADPFAVPARPAAQDVAAPPVPDTVTQLTFGAYSSAGGSGALAGSVTEVITALPSETTSVGQLVDVWSVQRTDAKSKATSVEVYQLVHPSTSPLGTSAGIYLVGMAWDDPVRGKLSFQPSGNGLWILPSPVQLAASSSVQYVGAATDPSTLATLALVRNVTGRKRVDACGALIDTFTVEMTGTLTTPDMQRQVTWTQQLATAYGGADVEETLSLTSVLEGFSWTRALRNTTVPKERP